MKPLKTWQFFLWVALICFGSVATKRCSSPAEAAAIQQQQTAAIMRRTVGGGAYSALATIFAGDDQCWMERDNDLTGSADVKAVTVSFWADFSGNDGVLQYIYLNASGRAQVIKQTNNLFRFQFQNSGGTNLVRIDQNATNVAAIVASSAWHHVMLSFDKAVETRRHLYIDGVECATVAIFESDDVNGNTDSIEFTRIEHYIGSDAGTSDFAGKMAEFYMAFEYIDLSNGTNRAKFYNAGAPVDLGATGSTPTGNQPIIYLKSLFSSFATNSGSGGNFVKKGSTAFADGGTLP